MFGRFQSGVWLLIVAIAFVAGTAGGAYYHNEISVVWRSLFVQSTTGEPSTPSLVDPETPTITFAQLKQPLPLVYSDTLEEARVQEYLTQGAVVLPLGTSFGEAGNVVVTAHSSGTSSFGPYRFAFSQLSELEADGYHRRILDIAAAYGIAAPVNQRVL